jgi:hypothetical protein
LRDDVVRGEVLIHEILVSANAGRGSFALDA